VIGRSGYVARCAMKVDLHRDSLRD
jgi:hypothetical protein